MITKGKADSQFCGSYEDLLIYVEHEGKHCLVATANNHCCDKERSMKDMDKEIANAKDNADFIAEAFNVHNETGLTPSQLAEQREELLEACKIVLTRFESNANNGGSLQDFLNKGSLKEIAVLAKAEGGE